MCSSEGKALEQGMKTAEDKVAGCRKEEGPAFLHIGTVFDCNDDLYGYFRLWSSAVSLQRWTWC